MNSPYSKETYPRFRRLVRTALGVAALAGASLGVGASPASADAGRQVYVALGDSMASGPLVPPITGPLACGRSTRNYAHLLAARLKVDAFRDVTCSGADTGDMTQPQKLSLLGVDAGTAPPQFDALSADTTLVTLTIGGNDAGLVGVAQDCLQLNPLGAHCKDAYIKDGVDQEALRIDALGPKLAVVLDTIHQRSPQARVLVTGYGEYIKRGGCWPVVPVLGSDADWLQGSVDRMNGVIAAQASAHGAEYVDVRTPSKGHDACQVPGVKWLEGFLPTAPAAPLHPNALGEQAYATFVGARIGG
ncbi:SGNH/GDSL hydrolase family protein [Streptomyces beijiangensis]|uniref:SGNH/GDSL hydrolase family protein n=1 Tax=Streptomyces beijiangensis TaxID=163361 RepID=A0A939F2V2_9ACTN|nr:SGNH/GDSL hydrolase family protein [Streptomyces beijiangensis]MBO0510374.1 SGNH/GDSL hydrolase family protein [Streptomyces beijiangensis]